MTNMQDQSLFNSSQPQGGISENLQRFIDAMVEEIVLEGKPFDTQKKYLKKFSENEGLDYDKLEADITTFIEILDSLKTVFSKLQVKLAEEKGRECHISEETVKKLVGHSSPSNQPKGKTQKKGWLFPILEGIILICCLLLVARRDCYLMRVFGSILCVAIVTLVIGFLFAIIKRMSDAKKETGADLMLGSMNRNRHAVLTVVLLLVSVVYFILMAVGVSKHIHPFTDSMLFSFWCSEEDMLFRLLDISFMLTPVVMLCSVYCVIQGNKRGFWSAWLLLLAYLWSGGVWMINYGSIGHLIDLSRFYSWYSFALLLLFEGLVSYSVFMKEGGKSIWNMKAKTSMLLGTINMVLSIGVVLMSLSGVMLDIEWFGFGGTIYRLFKGVLW